MASEALQYEPKFHTSIWRNDRWVASTNCVSGGNLEERTELAQRLVTRYNSHDALVAALRNAQAAFPCEMYADALKLAGELEAQNG